MDNDGWFSSEGGMVAIGLSRDFRTNIWSISCPYCRNSFTPQSTMLSWQHLACPNKKCRKEFLVNYNELKMKKLEPEGL